MRKVRHRPRFVTVKSGTAYWSDPRGVPERPVNEGIVLRIAEMSDPANDIIAFISDLHARLGSVEARMALFPKGEQLTLLKADVEKLRAEVKEGIDDALAFLPPGVQWP